MFGLRVEHNNKEAGKRSFYLMTSDAASLEARVATADTALNAQGIDPVLNEVYRPGSDYGEDLHSVTSFNTFFGSVQRKVLRMEENGKKWVFLPESLVKIKRGDEEKVVSASEIVETDSILDYAD